MNERVVIGNHPLHYEVVKMSLLNSKCSCWTHLVHLMNSVQSVYCAESIVWGVQPP